MSGGGPAEARVEIGHPDRAALARAADPCSVTAGLIDVPRGWLAGLLRAPPLLWVSTDCRA
jgi:hypothetical protein